MLLTCFATLVSIQSVKIWQYPEKSGLMKNIPILMYHNIGEPPDGARLRGLHVCTGAFGIQMWPLKLLGYQSLPMSETMLYLRAV